MLIKNRSLVGVVMELIHDSRVVAQMVNAREDEIGVMNRGPSSEKYDNSIALKSPIGPG